MFRSYECRNHTKIWSISLPSSPRFSMVFSSFSKKLKTEKVHQNWLFLSKMFIFFEFKHDFLGSKFLSFFRPARSAFIFLNSRICDQPLFCHVWRDTLRIDLYTEKFVWFCTCVFQQKQNTLFHHLFSYTKIIFFLIFAKFAKMQKKHQYSSIK